MEFFYNSFQFSYGSIFQRGHKYIDDIFYSVNKPDEDIQKLIAEHGCKLCSPSKSKEINIYYGLYMPIENNKLN